MLLKNGFVKGAYCQQNANFGDMDWTSDTPANISMTISNGLRYLKLLIVIYMKRKAPILALFFFLYICISELVLINK